MVLGHRRCRNRRIPLIRCHDWRWSDTEDDFAADAHRTRLGGIGLLGNPAAQQSHLCGRERGKRLKETVGDERWQQWPDQRKVRGHGAEQYDRRTGAVDRLQEQDALCAEAIDLHGAADAGLPARVLHQSGPGNSICMHQWQREGWN